MRLRTAKSNRPVWHLGLALFVAVATMNGAMAWGPKTQLALVTTALHILAKHANIPLDRLEEELRSGALQSMDMLREAYPGLEADPLNAIETEMQLLQTVKGNRVDPYFAFRLGALGKLVAQITAPMTNADAAFRSLYYADVDQHIDGVVLAPEPLRFVDPRSSFAAAILEARTNDELILKEYRAGEGFSGVGRAALPKNASRSANTVASVWHTVLTGRSISGKVSDVQLRDYATNAHRFYIGRDNKAEIANEKAKIEALVPHTPEMRVKVGDMLHAAGMHENAIAEYKTALEMEPGRPDVVEKIAAYYARQGDTALQDGSLEAALRAYESALDANPLHPSAERSRLEVVRLIEEREALRSAHQGLVEHGLNLTTEAERESMRGRYAEAISLLRLAGGSFEQVGNEFPLIRQRAARAAKDASFLIEENKRSIMANAQAYSGKAFGPDLRNQARTKAKGLDKKALEKLIAQGYAKEMARLAADIRQAIEVR